MSSQKMVDLNGTGGAMADPGIAIESFADFYRRNHRAVLGIVYTLSGSATAAEELTQDAFIRAHQHWDGLADHTNREAWVKRVAINLARSWLRRRLIEVKAVARLRREPPTVTLARRSARSVEWLSWLYPGQTSKVDLGSVDATLAQPDGAITVLRFANTDRVVEVIGTGVDQDAVLAAAASFPTDAEDG